VGWQEWICAISRVSTDESCGLLDDCIPQQALALLHGSLDLRRCPGQFPDDRKDHTRKAVMRMAQEILNREEVGLDLSALSAEELKNLPALIKAERQMRAERRALLPDLRERLAELHAERERLEAEIDAQAERIAEIETGKPVRFVRDAQPEAPSGDGGQPAQALGNADTVPGWKRRRDEKRLAKARGQGYTGDLAGLKGWNISRALKGKKRPRKTGLSPDAKALPSAPPGTVPSQLRR
jgi:uncharacterized small protein (DUF1192 family)